MARSRHRRIATTVCQSCGMPLQLDAHGQTAVGSPDDPSYCCHCYRAGAFVLPDLTVEQMQARVLAKLRDVGVSESRAVRLTRRIRSLQRWKVEA
jgi:hypothetical protein